MELLSRAWDALVGVVNARDLALVMLRLTLLGALGHLAVVALRRSSAAARHLVAVVTLAAMLAVPGLGLLGGLIPAVHVRVPDPERSPAPLATVLRALPVAPDAGVTPRPDPRRIAVELANLDEPTPAPQSSSVGETSDRPLAPELSESSIAPESPTPPAPPVFPIALHGSDWPALALLLALLGATVLLLSRATALLATLWIGERARPIADPRVRRAFALALARLDVREEVELLATDHLDVPAVIAFPRPRLLLPAAALAWDDARLLPVLVHELAHVQRRDGFGFAIGRFATALLWFHPLTWTLALVARQECERACDDVVLGAGVRASDYADQLLAIARSARASERWPSMSLAFARPSSLEGRLLAILRGDVRRAPVTRRTALAVSALLVLLLLPLATVRVVAEPYGKESGFERTRVATTSRTRTATVTRTGWAVSESAEASASSSVDDGNCPNAKSRVACNQTDDARDEVTAADPGDESKSGDQWFTDAKAHYHAKDFAYAGDAYERAANAGFDPGTAWYNAACSWSLAGKKNRAIGALQSAIDNGFNDPNTISSDGDLNPMHDDRRFQLLLASTVHVSHRDKDWKDWKNDKSAKDGRDGESLDDVDPEDASDLRATALTLMRGGDPQRAAKLFQREFAVDSSSSTLYNAACAYSIAGDRDRALDYLERAVYAGYNDGNHMRKDDDLSAIRHTQKFEELGDMADDLDFPWPNGFGLRSAELHGWQRLLPRLEEVTHKYPEAGRAWFNLGLAELRSEDYRASREAYLHCLSLGYRVKTSQYNLACAAAQAGDKDEAFRRLALAQQAGMDLGSIVPKDDDLVPLHGDSRYESLLDRIDADRMRAKKARWKDKS